MTDINNIKSNNDLLQYLQEANTVKYLFFWGHTPPKNGFITKSCFSQWYVSPFEIDCITYKTAEHYMMAEKALLFDDKETRIKIINSETPSHAKKLGRSIKNFDEDTWLQHRFDIVVKGNIAKFTQNPKLHAFLEATTNRILVEASPPDRIWGIGMASDIPTIEDPNTWNGLNLLGYALMQTRSQLRKK
ncbi:MAG: NADAR family protein [Akkermansiaceae bacterium]